MKSKPEATKSLPPTRLCGHPELHPTQWGQTKPAPAFMVGCIHNHSCPVCGFGQGIHPHDPNCPDRLTEVTDLATTDPNTTTEPLKAAPKSTNDKEEK